MKNKSIEICLIDGTKFLLEKDADKINVDIKDGMLRFYYNYDKNNFIFVTSVNTFLYYTWIQTD
jgi:hypothetical protein